MSRWWLLLFLIAGAAVAQYTVAKAGYQYEFPRDHFNHPEYETEWWYYTGNLRAEDGRRFGFELTFFRQGVDRSHAESSPWVVRDVYLAHFAISDLSGAKFWHTERLNRSGPGIAGVVEAQELIWNGNWQVKIAPDVQRLSAVEGAHAVDLEMRGEKPPVIHGRGGVSQKSAGEGHASHYLSFTRLLTRGTLEVDGKRYAVEGTSWMDHEFFTASMSGDLSGWDWLSLQLDDGAEVMLYRLRRKDGTVEPYSSGTYVAADGKSTFLSRDDFSMEPTGRSWTSGETKATYPIAWRVSVPRFGLDLTITTPLASQELAGKGEYDPSYWEGAIDVLGTRKGVGYLEMTGYAKALTLSH